MPELALPSSSALVQLLPAGALQRGSVVGVTGRTGVTSLTLALVVKALEKGRWGAVVGWPEFGVETASELGARLDHLALIPSPGPNWVDVVGALVDSLDLVVLRPSGRINASTARRLAARTRERGCVVLVPLVGRMQWPESFDTRFATTNTGWTGLGNGFGTFRQRLLDVEVDGRRVPDRGRTQLLIPTTAAPSGFGENDGLAITA